MVVQWPKEKYEVILQMIPRFQSVKEMPVSMRVGDSKRRSIRTTFLGLAATSVILGTTTPAAFASTAPIVWSKKNIDFTAYSAAGVSGYTENGTTYMPVWYVLQALKKSGYTASFDGKVLNLTPPNDETPNTTGLSVGSGNLSIEIGGRVVKRVVSQVRIDPASGKSTQYIPIYYIQQVLSSLSFFNGWNGTTWSGRPVSVTMHGDQTVAEGQMAAFSLEFQNPDGSLFIPDDAVTWSVDGNDGNGGNEQAQINQTTGIFTTSSPGVYNVTGSVDGFQWTKQISVYGPAVGVQLSASKTALIADGLTTSTITVKAVDTYGNLVPNFTGEVELSTPAVGGSFVGGITSTSDNQLPVYLYNGTGSATLTAPLMSSSMNEPVTASNLTSTSQTLPETIQYGSLNVSYNTPTVSEIGITPNTTTLNSGNYSANLQLTLNDSEGNPVTNSSLPGMYVTLTMNGPATFASGLDEKTTTTYLYPSSTDVSIPIYALAGQSGQVTVTASGDGVSGTTVLYSNPPQTNRSLSVNKAQGTLESDLNVGSTTLPVGTPFALYTVTVVDGNGNPLPQADTLWISDSTTNSALSSGQTGIGTSGGQADGLTYYSVLGTQPSQVLPTAATNTYLVSTSAATGKAQFIVFNTGNAPSTASIDIRDITTNATAVMTN